MATVEEIQAKIAELNVELEAARKQYTAELKARQVAVQRQWKFTIYPVENRKMSWEVIRDPAVILYTLTGVVTNKEECAAVGKDLHMGSMNYLFNTLSGRIIRSDGGGQVYIGGFGKATPEVDATYTLLEAFLVAHPEGGDVTGIILAQPNFAKQYCS